MNGGRNYNGPKVAKFLVGWSNNREPFALRRSGTRQACPNVAARRSTEEFADVFDTWSHAETRDVSRDKGRRAHEVTQCRDTSLRTEFQLLKVLERSY